MPSTPHSLKERSRSVIVPIITSREKEVLYHIAYEYTAKEIAQKLNISYETVNTHRQNLMRKLQVKNTAGLVRVAVVKNLI